MMGLSLTRTLVAARVELARVHGQLLRLQVEHSRLMGEYAIVRGSLTTALEENARLKQKILGVKR